MRQIIRKDWFACFSPSPWSGRMTIGFVHIHGVIFIRNWRYRSSNPGHSRRITTIRDQNNYIIPGENCWNDPIFLVNIKLIYSEVKICFLFSIATMDSCVRYLLKSTGICSKRKFDACLTQYYFIRLQFRRGT